jgi:hypothetical protein
MQPAKGTDAHVYSGRATQFGENMLAAILNAILGRYGSNGEYVLTGIQHSARLD